MLSDREEMEGMFRDTGGCEVRVAAERTWGHFVVEPQVELGPAEILDDVPTLTLPQCVPGLRMEALVEVSGQGSFRVRHRLSASSPGETTLVLEEV